MLTSRDIPDLLPLRQADISLFSTFPGVSERAHRTSPADYPSPPRLEAPQCPGLSLCIFVSLKPNTVLGPPVEKLLLVDYFSL